MNYRQQFVPALLLAVMLTALTEQVWAEDSIAPPADVAGAIDRGLAFLAADAVKWRTDHNCVSCHHAALVIWSSARSEAARPCGRRDRC